jgi:hypothetical protein
MVNYITYMTLYILLGMLIAREVYHARFRSFALWVTCYPFFLFRFAFHCLYAVFDFEVRT